MSGSGASALRSAADDASTADDRATGVRHVAIVSDVIDITALLAQVADAGIGATSLFLGTVRDVNDGRAVTGIEYEAYETMAEDEMRAIAEEACLAVPGLLVAVVHRVGTLQVGEVSVAIAAAHARRAPAVDSARTIIEALKQRVPIWKQEHYMDGDRAWVDPIAVGGQRGVQR